MESANRFTRRSLLERSIAALFSVALRGRALGDAFAPPSQSPAAFAQCGYYLTFMRMPTYGLEAWKQTLDLFAGDGINILILWVAGAFRSRRFPITWQYNRDHENVRADFAGELIRHAHGHRIKVLLGFTPFAYDGVNQYAIEHPELRAVRKDGRTAEAFGIHCWGWNLCASKERSRQFMLEYVREMLFDFYPEADGLLVESSDYGICHCGECRGHFYEREFEVVRTISQEVWKAKGDAATVVVYPHYFSGANVPGMGAEGARETFDPRWTLFFTPHSAHVEAGLAARAKGSIESDDAPALHDARAVGEAVRRTRDLRLTGYVPSLEAFSYVPTKVEEGREDLVGKRQVPFGFGWLKAEQMPYDELPLRVNRIAYREFTRDPDLSFDEFKRRLGREIFGAGADAEAAGWTEDLLSVQKAFFEKRTWCQPAPVVSPARVRADLAAGRVKAGQLQRYRDALKELTEIARRHGEAREAGRRELCRIAKWVVEQWSPGELEVLRSVGS